jgi:2-polyprenyl-3-methyl-5-hydroxy-6-metoxy-1,4-benzoquinol methylase
MENELLHQCNLCDSDQLDVLDAECNVAQCRRCGYVFDNPRPSLEELIRFYSQPGKYDSWLEESGARDGLWRRRLKVLRRTRKPGTLLDVGTGIGQFLWLARDSYSEVHGTEVSTTAIAIAKQKYGLDLFQGTIEDFAGQGRVFDNITLFHVLEHVPDPRAVIRACHSLLSPGGVVVIAVPNELNSLRARARRLLVRLRIKDPKGRGRLGLARIRLDGSIDEIHLSHFTPAVLQGFLKATGFTVVSSTLDPYQVRRGIHSLVSDIYYYICLGIQRLTRANLYDAILVIACKAGSRPAMGQGPEH